MVDIKLLTLGVQVKLYYIIQSFFCAMTGEPTTTVSVLTLYVWPGKWGLPSLDPICLATILYLQLVLPGTFSILECNNPDISPSGR